MQHPQEEDKERFIQRFVCDLERERELLIAQWRREMQKEKERLDPPWSKAIRKNILEPCFNSIVALLSNAEVFVANLPLTIAALALSWVTMGTVWFKLMEEVTDSCTSVHFYSRQCTFPEYPGCFRCDTTDISYQIALKFHYACSAVAGLFCFLFLLKVVIAWEVVVDELKNPTTSTPVGVVCIAIVCVFAGRGDIGGAVVIITSIFHVCLAFWFLYMAIYKFGLRPDPGWFPNTVGISYAAVKTWLYFPVAGLVLLSVSETSDGWFLQSEFTFLTRRKKRGCTCIRFQFSSFFRYSS